MGTPTIFISYSHLDEAWKDRFVRHLGVLDEGHLRTWNDRHIGPGDEWFEEIRKAIEAADVAILLVSANSLTSRFIRNEEVPRLLERRAREGMAFVPVIVGDCLWREVPWLSRFQALPRDGRALESFRGKLNSELAKIGKAILDAARNGKTSGAVPQEISSKIASPLQSLHQLPPAPRDFTGRQKELASLKEKLTQGGAGAIFGLRGMGGVGKTTLALKLAEELTPLYPDAQVYLDLKGVDPQSLTPAQAMAHVIRSFHPEVPVPEDQVQLAALYRSVLHDKRTILLMDNASRDGRAQVEPLIPPTGSLLLVTSRFHFTLPGLVPRDLDEMSQKEACDLLLRIDERIGADADEIARLCGCLPLALRLSGSALAERPTLSPAEYIRQLKEGRDRLDGVDVSLRASYNLLDEDQRKLWRWLGVFPDTFDLAATVTVWELDEDSVQKGLDDLVRYSLVEWDPNDRRYRLHDLAREFAVGLLKESEQKAARLRHTRHYLEVLDRADVLYLKGGEQILVGLRLFDTERSNIQAGQAWAAKSSAGSEEAADLCSSYPAKGTYVLHTRLHPREQIQWREAALEAARQQGDRSQEGYHLGNLGLAYEALGEPYRAIELNEQWLVIAREIGDRHGKASALGGLGIAYAALGEPRRAIELYQQQLAITREIGDQRGEIIALNNLGIAYEALGEPRRAIELYQQQLVMAHEIGDRRGEAHASWNLGLHYEEEGNLHRAADLMQVRVDFEREIGHPDAEENAARVEAIRARLREQGS